MKPQNFAERLIWLSILWTYAFYLIGGLYILGSVLGWILLLHLCYKLWRQNDETTAEERVSIPWSVWVWIAGMLVMQLALIMGHLDFNLGLAQTIKSSIGWAKGWALLAIYPLVGCLKIRPQLMYRAACKICAFTLAISIPFILAFYLNLPQRLYVSPLHVVGGSGPEFFEVMLYEIDPGEGKPRWRLFAPWAPAMGFVANIYFFMVLQERDRKWRGLGILGCLVMVLISASRLALLCMPTVLLGVLLLSRLSRPLTLFGLGITSFVGGIAASQIIEAAETFLERFTAARRDSSRVRDALGQIALYRWENEAPIWGHGTVERGPHLVEFMPIGSHHSWYGLLFVKGIVGFAALSIPMACSGIDLAIKAQKSEAARVGLSMLLVLFLYTFGENLEILAYLIWPGLVMMGIGFNAKNRVAEIES
ncbi:MAG: O-antigen ligase domain-containing protein [Pseudanabaena sp. CRU_2_10]|nr:O-antigen ligase domain-containing protein [Pseudanabaena sp. CRU_2_10]